MSADKALIWHYSCVIRAMAGTRRMSGAVSGDEVVRRRLETMAGILSASTPDLVQLKSELTALLEHLSSPAGRTDENCRAVDWYFTSDETWVAKELPSDLHDILADMASALHDTVSHPDVARDCDSTPEQLLERLKVLGSLGRIDHPSDLRGT